MTVKGFPLLTNIFSNSPIPPPGPTAQTLEEMKEDAGYEPEPEFPHVILAWDTRESSPFLINAIKTGLETFHVPYTEKGLITTPMLHYILANHKLNLQVENYLTELVSAYMEFMEIIEPRNRHYERRLLVDCSNGVASPYMAQLANMVSN